MLTLALPLRNTRLHAIAAAIDAAATPGTLTLYTGTRPGNGAPITDQLTLVVIECPKPFADTVESGILTGRPFADAMSTGQGVAAWGRFHDGDGLFVADADVGELQDDGNGNLIPTSDINLPNTVIYPGMLIRPTAATIAE